MLDLTAYSNLLSILNGHKKQTQCRWQANSRARHQISPSEKEGTSLPRNTWRRSPGSSFRAARAIIPMRYAQGPLKT